MKRILLLAVLVALLPCTANAIDTTVFPHTLVDSTCTDTEDTPNEAQSTELYLAPAVQTTGDADTFCDHDSRIKTGALTADLDIPINLPGCNSGLLIVDADTVSNDTDTWRVALLITPPHESALRVLDATPTQATEGNKSYLFGISAGSGAAVTDHMTTNMPSRFTVRLDVISATSWAGNISVICFGNGIS